MTIFHFSGKEVLAMRFRIDDIKPVSVNEANKFNRKTGTFYLDRNVKDFKSKLASRLLREYDWRDLQGNLISPKTELKLEIIFGFPRNELYTKKNELRKLDIDNLAKYAIDPFFLWLRRNNRGSKVDDHQVVELKLRKMVCEKYSIEFNLEIA